MARRSTARYTAKDELSRMVTAMKIARKSSGYNQRQFARLIGISRETVVSIEGLVECTVLTLECEILKRWLSVCANRISATELEILQSAICNYVLPTTLNTKNQQQKVA